MCKSYILTHLHDAITISQLAKHIGTNDCYLKKGFKDYTGSTIFEFIQEHRMTKARHLVLYSQLPLIEIASQVGYTTLSGFGVAYKNYFGHNPSQDSKQILL